MTKLLIHYLLRRIRPFALARKLSRGKRRRNDEQIRERKKKN